MFTLLTLGVTFPLVWHLTDGLPGDLGDPLLNAWILAWDAERLAHGFAGLWQAPIFHPYPDTLAYSEHLLGIAVLVAPLQWVFGNPVLTYNVAFLLSYVLAGAGMYLLVRSLTGSRWAGLLAGVAFAFCPYRAPQVYHLQVLMSGWMPIGLWALHRYHHSGSRLALTGFTGAFTMQGLSNGYFLYFFAVPVAVVCLYALWRPRAGRGRMLAELGVAALIGLLVFAPIALVYYEVRESQGFVRDMGEITHFSGDLADYLQVDRNLVLWGRLLSEARPEKQLFPGLIVTALAGLALVGASGRLFRPRSNATPGPSGAGLVWLYTAIALLGVLLSLGPEARAWGVPILPAGPYRLGMLLVPGLDGLRVPARLAVVVYLALSVLAGMGVAAWCAGRSRRMCAGLGTVLATLLLIEGYAGPMAVASLAAETRTFDTQVYRWLREQPPGAVLELPMEGRHANLQASHTLGFQYRTLEHGHPIVNGFSGYSSTLVDFLPVAPAGRRQVAGELLEGLRSLGVRYVIVHEALYADRNVARATTAALRSRNDEVAAVTSIGSIHVFDLGEVEWPYRPPPSYEDRGALPVTAFTGDASDGAGRLAFAWDGDVDTSWTTGRPQRGDEWIILRFDRPRSIARVRFQLAGGTWGDYPRRLQIEASSDGQTFDRVLYDQPVLPTLIAAIPGGGRNPVVDIPLPDQTTSALRFNQLGAAEAWRWTINELTLWERGASGP